MNQDNESRFHCSKKQYLSEKKFVQRGSPEKKIPAQAVSEKKNFVQAENLMIVYSKKKRENYSGECF